MPFLIYGKKGLGTGCVACHLWHTLGISPAALTAAWTSTLLHTASTDAAGGIQEQQLAGEHMGWQAWLCTESQRQRSSQGKPGKPSWQCLSRGKERNQGAWWEGAHLTQQAGSGTTNGEKKESSCLKVA